MKKLTMIGMAVVGSLAVAGFSVAEVGEYLEVARNRMAQEANEHIPLSVEIDRMEVLIGKLDRQVRSHATSVANAQVALEDGEEQLADVDHRCKQILSDLTTLRDACQHPEEYVMVTQTCSGKNRQTVRPDRIERALEYKAAEWKLQRSESAARQSAVDAQRSAFHRLQSQFDQWKLQKELLRHRLEALKARYAAQQLSDEANVNVIEDADLRRAVELADEIEKNLRISEVRDEVSVDPASDVLSEIRLQSGMITASRVSSQKTENILDEVDQILKNNTAE